MPDLFELAPKLRFVRSREVKVERLARARAIHISWNLPLREQPRQWKRRIALLRGSCPFTVILDMAASSRVMFCNVVLSLHDCSCMKESNVIKRAYPPLSLVEGESSVILLLPCTPLCARYAHVTYITCPIYRGNELYRSTSRVLYTAWSKKFLHVWFSPPSSHPLT